MTGILDASAALRIALSKAESERLVEYLESADHIVAPDLFIPEVTNAFWKYHRFEGLAIEHCEFLLENTLNLIDEVLDTGSLYKEAFALSCKIQHPVYDAFYLIAARRLNGILITSDTRLKNIAEQLSIKTC